jgi:hypothetical protein
MRVRQAAGSHKFRLRDAKLLEGSLQSPVIEERDLNSILDVQGIGEKLCYALFDEPSICRDTPVEWHILANAARRFADLVEATIARKARAAR